MKEEKEKFDWQRWSDEIAKNLKAVQYEAVIAERQRIAAKVLELSNERYKGTADGDLFINTFKVLGIINNPAIKAESNQDENI